MKKYHKKIQNAKYNRFYKFYGVGNLIVHLRKGSKELGVEVQILIKQWWKSV